METTESKELAAIASQFAEDEFAYFSRVNKDSDVKQGELIINDLQYLSHDPKTIRFGLLRIWLLLLEENNREYLFSKGLVQLVVNAMQTYPKDADVILICCKILDKAKGNLKLFFLAGAGQEIIKAMDRFPKEDEIQRFACGAIKTLGCFKFNSSIFAHNLSACKKIGNAMKNFPDNEGLQRYATGALWCLAIYGDANEAIWTSGVHREILTVMRRFPSKDRIQEHCCGFLFTLGYTVCLMKCGAALAVMETMGRHSSHERITSYGSFLLKNMGQFKTCAGELVSMEAPEVIMESIRKNTNPEVKENGLMALWSMSLWQETKKELLVKGVGTFVIGILSIENQHVNVFNQAVSVLANLATHKCKTNLLNRVEAGRFVADGWKRNERNESCTEKSLFCLRNLFYFDRDARNLKALDVEKLINRAMKKYDKNRTIAKKGKELLTQLERG